MYGFAYRNESKMRDLRHLSCQLIQFFVIGNNNRYSLIGDLIEQAKTNNLNTSNTLSASAPDISLLEGSAAANPESIDADAEMQKEKARATHGHVEQAACSSSHVLPSSSSALAEASAPDLAIADAVAAEMAEQKSLAAAAKEQHQQRFDNIGPPSSSSSRPHPAVTTQPAPMQVATLVEPSNAATAYYCAPEAMPVAPPLVYPEAPTELPLIDVDPQNNDTKEVANASYATAARPRSESMGRTNSEDSLGSTDSEGSIDPDFSTNVNIMYAKDKDSRPRELNLGACQEFDGRVIPGTALA
jgi:hypothetical protein